MSYLKFTPSYKNGNGTPRYEFIDDSVMSLDYLKQQMYDDYGDRQGIRPGEFEIVELPPRGILYNKLKLLYSKRDKTIQDIDRIEREIMRIKGITNMILHKCLLVFFLLLTVANFSVSYLFCDYSPQ